MVLPGAHPDKAPEIKSDRPGDLPQRNLQETMFTTMAEGRIIAKAIALRTATMPRSY